MAYSGHNGVKYSRWKRPEGEDKYPEDPVIDETNAVVEELYFDDYTGTLDVTVETEDGFLSLSIPVKADSDWNTFVESLPQWDV